MKLCCRTVLWRENQCTIGMALTPWELLADSQPGTLMKELIYYQNNVSEPISG